MERRGSKRLVAVWIDSAMRAFEKELATSPVTCRTGEGEGDVSRVPDKELQESEDGLVATRLHIEGEAPSLRRMPRY